MFLCKLCQRFNPFLSLASSWTFQSRAVLQYHLGPCPLETSSLTKTCRPTACSYTLNTASPKQCPNPNTSSAEYTSANRTQISTLFFRSSAHPASLQFLHCLLNANCIPEYLRIGRSFEKNKQTTKSFHSSFTVKSSHILKASPKHNLSRFPTSRSSQRVHLLVSMLQTML